MANWAYAILACTMINGDPQCHPEPVSIVDNFTTETACVVFAVISTTMVNNNMFQDGLTENWAVPSQCQIIEGEADKFFVY
tara:strand:- start:140 stop:382 length:243 start_codon:yes stop_codon:yes gene_type:complete